MKKIKTLFKREYEGNKVIRLFREVNEGCEWVLEGKGVATIKYDGTCCLIEKGKLYRRFDAKPGRKIPKGAIACCEADPITGHHPHWIEVNLSNPTGDEKYYVEGVQNTFNGCLSSAEDGTYELCGPMINGNREKYGRHILIKHGQDIVDVERTYEGIRNYLETHYIEGLVFHDENRMCKIKRRDFGLEWK